MLDLCHALIQRYLSPLHSLSSSAEHQVPVCRANDRDNAQKCDAMLIGSLLVGLNRNRLWPIPESPYQLSMGANSLVKILTSLVCYESPSDYYTSHETCSFTLPLRDDIKKLMGQTKSGMLPSHREHLEEQRQKMHACLPQSVSRAPSL